MKIIECEQGSEDWHLARAGCITASMFKVARERVGGLDEKQEAYVNAVLSGIAKKEAWESAGYRAAPKAKAIDVVLAGGDPTKPSDAAKKYAFRLAVERISGLPLDDGFQTYAMRRGNELEPEARREHEVLTGKFVRRAGFVKTDDLLFGASADGLIDEDGGSEYKCLMSPESLMPVLLDDDISEFIDQIQGCMWVTGRKWWHYAMYCPALQNVGKQLYFKHVDRDDNYIEKLESDLIQFEKLVTQYQKILEK